MNYIIEINKFYDWLETNPVSDSSIVLWHALMHINNKCGWKQEFAVAISSIQNKTGLSKSSILRARNILQQSGRISFISRNGQQSAVYSIISFHTDTQTDTQSEAQTVTQSGAQSGAQTVPILKLNKKKLNKIHSSPVGEPKKMYWKNFVEVFDNFYKEHAKEKYQLLKKDFGCLEKIYTFLEGRAISKKREWTEDVMIETFNFFLNKAWQKDDWLQKNFSIPNLLSQFNQIVKESTNGIISRSVTATGEKLNGSKHSAGANKLAEQLKNNLTSTTN